MSWRRAAVVAAAVATAGCSLTAGPTGPSVMPPSSAPSRTVTHFPGMPHEQHAGFVVIGHGTGDSAAGGLVRTGPAWSTIKVPLSIAALKQGGSNADVALAIEASKNEPADRLWAALGEPEDAGRLTRAELVAGGDHVTEVETRRVFEPYSAFGQTTWALVDQARFATTLPCRADATQVYADMAHARVAPEDRVGFGAAAMAPQAHYKIGWGPAQAPDTGSYARELATVTLGDGRMYGIALMAKESTLAAAQQDLNDLAAWLGPHLREIAAQGC